MANKMTLEYVKNTYNTYEDRMIAAFVGKPEKVEYYRSAFYLYNKDGAEKMRWKWSWWAFFGNLWYFLYRKAYLAALVAFILSIVFGIVHFGGLIFSILVGGFGVYFVYKKYKDLKSEIEAQTEDEDERIKLMIQNGGYNTWVIWLVVILTILGLVGAILGSSIEPNQFQ